MSRAGAAIESDDEHRVERKTLMMAIIGGGLIVFTSLVFWHLLPHNGRELRNSGIGSMVTIGLMTTLTFGVALLWSGLSGWLALAVPAADHTLAGFVSERPTPRSFTYRPTAFPISKPAVMLQFMHPSRSGVIFDFWQ
jgi:hypothetical protein